MSGRAPDPGSPIFDPFGERHGPLRRRSLALLGGRFEFESNHDPLLRLAMAAFEGLPGHRLAREQPRMRVRLTLGAPAARAPGQGKRARPPKGAGPEPPPVTMFSGGGFLGGATRSASCVLIAPQERQALVVVSPEMLDFPYHTRYELIEFAVYMLAQRVQQLAPLHGACVGVKGRGVLLMGPSGAGKSTVALQCLSDGFDFLSEDSVLVAPERMLATGASNFVHVRSDSLRWVASRRDAAAIRRSPVITRRSGVRKYEVDLRGGRFRIAQSPLSIQSIVFLSPRSADGEDLLTPLSRKDVRGRLAREQAYATGLPQWRRFSLQAAKLPCFELRRGRHPAEAAQALRRLLDSNSPVRRLRSLL